MLTVIIPAYNEEGGIVLTVTSVRNTLEAHGIGPFEIIVVDDGSTDSTADLIASLDAEITLIKKPQNIGYGNSLKLGIIAAKYDTIAIMDADGTYPPEMIPILLDQYVKGFDMVVGQRTGAFYRESSLKHPMRLILKFLVEFACARSIPDPNSGLRIFSKSAVSDLLPTLCDRFSFTTSLTLAYMMLQRYVCYIPISYEERIGKTKVKLIKDSLITLQYIVQAINFYNPLKIFIVLSLLLFTGSVLLLFSGLMLKATTLIQMGIVLIASSVIVFALGLLADLINQIRQSIVLKIKPFID